jgi:hypothetical protein
MDPASAYIGVAVGLAFGRARGGRRFGEASVDMQKELSK